MQATLFLHDIALGQKLDTIFLLAGIDLAVVSSCEDVLAAAERDQPDFLVIDASRDVPEDVEDCRRLLQGTTLPVHVISPREAIQIQLRPFEHWPGLLGWTPLSAVGQPLLDKLEALAPGDDVGQRRPHTVLLVAGHDVRCEGLHSMLRQEPLVTLTAVVSPSQVERMVRHTRPAVVLVAAELGRETMTALAEAVEQQPEVRLIVFGDRVDRDLELALARINAGGYVLWNEVDAIRLHWLLGTVLECGLHVGSQAMVREIACQGPQLTPLQRQVLTGLIHGLTRQGIVQAYALSESDRRPGDSPAGGDI